MLIQFSNCETKIEKKNKHTKAQEKTKPINFKANYNVQTFYKYCISRKTDKGN